MSSLWKLNASLLADTSYINFIKSVIQEAINDSKNLSDNYMIWDFIKCRIRPESITYSINKRKRDKKDIETLNVKLLELEENICSSPTPDYLEEYNLIQNWLENMYDKIANGQTKI